MKKCINSSSSSNVTFTSTNEKSDDHEEVQNAHYDTLCKIDDININVSRTQIIIIIFINSH